MVGSEDGEGELLEGKPPVLFEVFFGGGLKRTATALYFEGVAQFEIEQGTSSCGTEAQDEDFGVEFEERKNISVEVEAAGLDVGHLGRVFVGHPAPEGVGEEDVYVVGETGGGEPSLE